MKVTNRQIFEGFRHLMDLEREKLPVKTQYRLVKSLRAIHNAHDDVDRMRRNLISQHCERSKNGDEGEAEIPFQMSDGTIVNMQRYNAFMRDLDELLAEEVELENVSRIRLSELRNPKGESLELTLGAMVALDWLIEDEGEDK